MTVRHVIALIGILCGLYFVACAFHREWLIRGSLFQYTNSQTIFVFGACCVAVGIVFWKSEQEEP